MAWDAEKDKESPTYLCISCGSDTGIPKERPMDPDPYYTFPRWIEGAGGPLCGPCDKDIYKDSPFPG